VVPKFTLNIRESFLAPAILLKIAFQSLQCNTEHIPMV
jgi:hypothetical protein